MKQKIIFQIEIICSKCPSKALRIVAEAHGVESVAVEGQQKNMVAVIGDGIDIISLARRLRKKFGCADIISVSEVK
ncbi:hypothetical protein CDL12_14112 [Handroanthus impetiginosus]|uniref:Copper chaperone n=1 Tax=Handroanthus impetiginosus TaxID=429701 RepID=A0A2G9H6X6_9LAMI|nr:hypothetical protein CDL12_14112 [Handroanthus impetiginosus]